MKRNRRLANRIISVILCIAILFSQVNIADAENLNPSPGNTNQVTASSDANAGSREEKVINDSLDSNETSGTTESAPSVSEKTGEDSKNDEAETSGEDDKAESTDNIDAYYKDIGMQKGAIVESCSVTDGTNTIGGKNFVGGFVGLARDDVIEGTLSGALDIETKLPKMNTESLLLNCSLNNAVVSVSGESYIGGFAGGLANASTVNCNVKSDNALTVTASGNYAGGFAGIASLGWTADLGKDDTKDNLLGGLVDLVVKLLSSNPGATSSLLSLAGVNPSHILGCSVNAPLQVSGKDYVGGITGRGNGAYIAQSNADNLQKISYWKNSVYDVGSVPVVDVSLTGLSSVTGNDYVGGIAGSMGTASVAGLLNTTLGVASYLAFTVDNVHVNGAENGFTITGNERVAGGFGDTIGGSITTVSINNLASIEGNNLVGGFIGLSGPGDLAGADGGLTVNLLGLNYLLKLNNLLSLGQAIEVKINKVNVNGATNGFTVHAKGTYSGTAGGFGGSLLNGSVKNSKVTNLSNVRGLNSVGGFVPFKYFLH